MGFTSLCELFGFFFTVGANSEDVFEAKLWFFDVYNNFQELILLKSLHKS